MLSFQFYCTIIIPTVKFRCVNDRFFSVNDRFAARKTTPGKDPREHCPVFFAALRSNAVLNAFESLDCRERMLIAAHLGFCPECFETLAWKEKDGVPVLAPRKKQSLIELANCIILICADHLFGRFLFLKTDTNYLYKAEKK